MRKMRYGLFVLSILLCSANSVPAQVSIGISTPHVSIGINLPLFPELVPVPGYPVYYAPRVQANYFFYDGLYWVFLDDYWHASYWYNGPWWIVEPVYVPVYILRVPVSYYRVPPPYFRHWHSNAPPRWGEHWGRSWEQSRRGWDRWNRGSAPARAPLPVYQRRYTGERYPSVDRQRALRDRNYKYQPRDKVVRQHFHRPAAQGAPAPVQRERRERDRPTPPRQHETQRPTPLPQAVPPGRRMEAPQRGEERIQRPAPVQRAPQQRGPEFQDREQRPGPPRHEQREQQAPRSQGPEHRAPDRGEPGRGHGQGQDKGEGRGGGRDK